MEDEERPNPDELLKKIQQEEEKKHKGRLKIFFGMCAGAGKTYSMLKAAQQAQKEGFDIIIGYIETHKRKDTEQLLDGLTILPRKMIEYRNIMLEEMDIDAVMECKNKIVLVDELAHTNVLGSRHLKRYQDVLELINNGIEVWTTLNVQHLESRAGTVAEITGIKINETVPDSIFENADEIELIDISPEELLKRLTEGKVYIPENAANALQNFFKKGNLYALRELSLRLTAERVDMDMLDYMHAKKIVSAWKTNEKLLVAVGPSPLSQNLIRWTRRMAYNLGVQWVAVSIETNTEQTEKGKKALSENLELAKELGAKIVHVFDTNVVSGLIRAAKDNNVAQIVIGKTKQNLFKNFLKGGSIVDKLIDKCGNIDIYVVNTEKNRDKNKKSIHDSFSSKSLKKYFISVLIIAVASIMFFLIRNIVGYQTIGLMFLLVVACISLFFNRGQVIFSAILTSCIWDYFFIPPIFAFEIHFLHDYITLLLSLFISIVLGTLINRIRKNQITLTKSQDYISRLFEFLELMNNSNSIKDSIKKAGYAFKKFFNIDLVIYLKEKEGVNLHNRPFGNKKLFSEKEFGVASWTFDNNKVAGKFTNTLPSAELKYYPLMSSEKIIGTIGLKFNDNFELAQNEISLIESLISLLSNTLLREINIDLVKNNMIK